MWYLYFFIGLITGSLITLIYFKYVKSDKSSITDLYKEIFDLKNKFENYSDLLQIQAEQNKQLIKSWIDSSVNYFNEINRKSEKFENLQSEQIKKLIEDTRMFFTKQINDMYKFLEQQNQFRDNTEKQKDLKINEMKQRIDNFINVISGTKKRGIIGENILENSLASFIITGIVKKNLKTENGEVEFAWKLDNGKYIPIDSKLPDIFNIVEHYERTTDVSIKDNIKKTLLNKIRRQIKNIQKYQNLSNTIDYCIMAVPEIVLEVCPEIIAEGVMNKVYICSYKDIISFSNLLAQYYNRMNLIGDIGDYNALIDKLFQIFDKIVKKIEVIEKSNTQIINATSEIRNQINIAYKEKKQ